MLTYTDLMSLDNLADCTKSKSLKASYSCTHGELNVYWPIELSSLSKNGDIPITVKKVLQERLKKKDFTHFSMTVASRTPP